MINKMVLYVSSGVLLGIATQSANLDLMVGAEYGSRHLGREFIMNGVVSAGLLLTSLTSLFIEIKRGEHYNFITGIGGMLIALSIGTWVHTLNDLNKNTSYALGAKHNLEDEMSLLRGQYNATIQTLEANKELAKNPIKYRKAHESSVECVHGFSRVYPTCKD